MHRNAPYTICMAQISSAQTDIVEETRISHIAVESISCNCFPTAMLGLASLPLTKKHLHKFDVVQRRMLRSIVCWVCIPDEHWETTMRRMNQKMEHAASIHPLQSWIYQSFTNQYRLVSKIASNQSAWAATAIASMLLNDWVHNLIFLSHHQLADRWGVSIYSAGAGTV